MQRWSEDSTATSLPTPISISPGASLAELACSSYSLSPLRTVREEEMSRDYSPDVDGGPASSSHPPFPEVSSPPAEPKFAALVDFMKKSMDGENGDASEDLRWRVLEEIQVCGRLISNFERQLKGSERKQAQLAGEMSMCNQQVDLVEKRVDNKLRKQSLAIQQIEMTAQDHAAKLQEIQDINGLQADATLSAIDDRLSGLCMRLEDAAPSLAAPAQPRSFDKMPPSELPRIDGSEDDSCPPLDQWGRQVTLLRRELQEAVDEANSHIADCERRCSSLESVQGSTEQLIFTEELEQLKDCLHKLETEQSRHQHNLKEQLETLAKAGDDDVAGLSANVTSMGANLLRFTAEHKEALETHRDMTLRLEQMDSRVKGSLSQIAAECGSLRVAVHGMLTDLELKMREETRISVSKELMECKAGIEKKHADLRDFFMKERQALDLAHAPLLARLNELQSGGTPSPLGAAQDFTKMREDILAELSSQYAQVSDQMTDKVKKIVARERHVREADMESALMAAISTIFVKLTSGDRTQLKEEDKDMAMKAALGVLGSASTKAPTSEYEDEEAPVLVRTVADRSAPPFLPAQVMQVMQSVPAISMARLVQAPAPQGSPSALEYRRTASPLRTDAGESLMSAPSTARMAEVKSVAPMPMSPARNLRHTLSGTMINFQRPPGPLPTSPQQSSRRTLSPTNLRRAQIQGTAQNQTLNFQSSRRLLPVPSSPVMPSRP